MAAADPGFALYVHWPFCASKCPYCDFNSHVRQTIDPVMWRDALLRDLHTQADLFDRQPLTSIFFGGGTPSLMDPSTVAAVIDTAQSLWGFAPDIEITLEANPTSVEADRFQGFATAGVNRVSVGVQALQDAHLKALGRLHSVEEALAAYDIAQTVFGRTSFDLIYARQNQSLTDWEQELTRAVSIAGDHLSLYQLTVEQNTRFWDLNQRGLLRGLPDDAQSADMYQLTQDMCTDAGYVTYEVSNHAKPGAACRHNLTYWRYGSYVGIGPGAHGRVGIGATVLATVAEPRPEEWLKAVEDKGHGLVSQTPVPTEEQAIEYLMMGLRLKEGVDLTHVTALGGQINQAALDGLLQEGFLERSEDRLRTTGQGVLVLNRVLSELIA